MTRKDGVALWTALLDAGFSASLSGSVTRDMLPDEAISLAIHAMTIRAHELTALQALAEAHDAEIHLSLSGQAVLRLMPKPKPVPRKP